MLIDTDKIRLNWANYPAFRTERDKTALLIIDMINSFCPPQADDSPEWVRHLWGRVVPAAQALLEAARERGVRVVHVQQGRWTGDGHDLVPYMWGRPYGTFDSEEMAIIPQLAPAPGEIVIQKVGSSAFTTTGLDRILRHLGVEYLVLTGQWSTACVFYTLIGGRELGYGNVIVSDASLAPSEEMHELFLSLIGAQWGLVRSAADVIEEWR